ncbi:hypothetical protein, partial [Bifidobacterium jacchi]|uniref:hypothetical protein n=1 Tax=Bifidobacterium jacchi TaxID=2490545 RepID=UPI0019D586E7
ATVFDHPTLSHTIEERRNSIISSHAKQSRVKPARRERVTRRKKQTKRRRVTSGPPQFRHSSVTVLSRGDEIIEKRVA